MIDIENQVFSRIAKDVRDFNENVFITGEYVKQPPRFPHVSVVESDNQLWRKTADSSFDENHARLFYEVNIYSNKQFGKKSECKELANIIDDTMGKLGFTRMNRQSIPNGLDSTVYRIYMRYRAVVSKDEQIYRWG